MPYDPDMSSGHSRPVRVGLGLGVKTAVKLGLKKRSMGKMAKEPSSKRGESEVRLTPLMEICKEALAAVVTIRFFWGRKVGIWAP